MANAVFLKFIEQIGLKQIDWTADTIKVMLLKSTYSFDVTDVWVSDLVAHEADCGGYTGGYGGAGRKSIGTKTVTIDTGNVRVEFDGQTDPSWANLDTGNTLGCAIVFKEGAADASSPLIAFIDTITGSPTFPFATNGSSFTLTLDTEGLLWGTP